VSGPRSHGESPDTLSETRNNREKSQRVCLSIESQGTSCSISHTFWKLLPTLEKLAQPSFCFQ
jgi:hypothetical protein